ncbi:MAG: tetratricopeptide repeat protein [Myxococcota bacterium]
MLLLAALSSGCVLDRTGQSASEVFRKDLLLHATRLTNIENQFDQIEARTAQLEELYSAEGQQDILQMETLEELRSEVARIRGQLEVLDHDYGNSKQSVDALIEDASFRLAWLESRADQLEDNLGLAPPPPPDPVSDTTPDDIQTPHPDPSNGNGGDDTNPDAALTDADAILSAAEAHLAAGREPAAEALLKRFLALHPDHPLLPQVLYRRAEAAFNRDDFSSAVLRFQEVIDGHKDSSWAAWAMLRQGECFDKQDQPENARLFYEDVMRIWPGTDAAKEARQKLRK